MVWVVVGIASIWVGFRIVLVLCALFERRACRPLRPVESDHRKAQDSTSSKVVAAATSIGYQAAGVYSDGDKGVMEGIVTLLVSGDARVLLCVHHARTVRRHRLMSRKEDGTWLITANLGASRDLSGLTDERMLPTQRFTILEGYHRQRLAESLASTGTNVAAIAPVHAAAELSSLGAMTVKRLVEMGLAKPVHKAVEVFPVARATGDPLHRPEFRWRFTLRGAIKMGAWPSLANTKRQIDLAKALEIEQRVAAQP